MAGKKIKNKVVSIQPVNVEDLIAQGQDPRLTMTEEEIQAFIRQEEEQLARRIGKFATEVVQPDTTGLEIEEEGETFTIDLENKTVEMKEETILLGDKGLLDKVFAEENPFTRLITDIYVSRALAKLLKTLRKEQDDMIEFGITAKIGPAAKEINKVGWEKYDALAHEIRMCWVQGTNKVVYEKMTPWIKEYVEGYIEESLRSLILFSDED